MKVVLVFVSSLDGKATKWGSPDVREWSSKQDQEYFKGLWDEAKLIIMGSNTFNAGHFSATSDRLLVVMTNDPSNYKKQEVPGQIEFTDTSPVELTERFQKAGYQKMMVVGGAQVATSFFKDELIDELWLTIEPIILGTGGSFVNEEKLNIDLQLIGFEKVNERGTLITKYAVIKKQKDPL